MTALTTASIEEEGLRQLRAKWASEPVSFSELKHIGQSPAHYIERRRNPIEPTANMLFGTAVHAMVLGGRPIVQWAGDRRGNAWLEFAAEHKDATILKQKEYDEARRCADAILSDPVAAPLLVGRREYPLEWTFMGRRCRTRGIDVLGAGFLTELKTTSCSESGTFSRESQRMQYHAQVAFYSYGVEAVMQENVERIFLVAAERRAPYAVSVLELPEEGLSLGTRTCIAWLERLKTSEASDQWPTYTQGVSMLEVYEPRELTGFDDE